MKSLANAAAAALLLAGCAAPVLRLPSDSPVSITVVSGARSSEFSGNDHLIPDSQVFVGGSRRGGEVVGGLMGWGLLGYGMSSAVNAALHASDLGDAADGLKVRFNDIVVDALKTQPTGQLAAGPRIIIAKGNDLAAAIELEPMARLVMVEQPKAYLVFVLNANFDIPGVHGKNNRISYVHGGYGARAIRDGKDGWADQGGAPFRAAAQRAFVRMTDVFKADLRGELKRDAAGLKRIEWRTPDAKASAPGVVLYEQPDYVAIMPLLKSGEPLRNSTVLVERSQIVSGS